MINSQNLKYENDMGPYPFVQKGQVLELKNNFTEALKNGIQGERNCHGGAYTATKGGEIGTFMHGSDMDSKLLSEYTSISESEAVPMKTIVRYGGTSWHATDNAGNRIPNVNLHSAVYYTTSRDGTNYGFQIPSHNSQLEIIKLPNIFSNAVEKGSIQGAPSNPYSTTNRAPVSVSTGWYLHK